MARLHREKLRVLLEEIVRGEYPPGAALPREVDLQASLGVSRGVVRELLRALEERGMVEVRHGVPGAVVAPPERWGILDAEVSSALLRGPARLVLMAELVECRRVVEVDATRLAVARASDEELADVVRIWEGLHELPKRDRWERGRVELDLHIGIVRAAHNAALAAAVTPVLNALSPVADRLGGRVTSVREHADVLAPLQYRDADAAAAAMDSHLRELASSIQRHGRQRAQPEAAVLVDRYSGRMAAGGALRDSTEKLRAEW